MRYLITGGAGFIGSHMADRLLSEGHQVHAVDDLSTGSPRNVAHLEDDPRFTLTVADILDCPELGKYVEQSDEVIHLAAAVGVKLIMERPVETLVTNVRGTERVLEFASRHGRKTLVASTSEVYGKAMENGTSQGALSEKDDWTLGPTSKKRWAYACSKALDEFLALAYHDEYDLPVVVARYFNTVGPRQTGRYGMVIPTFVKAALEGEPIPVHGDGSQSRSFTHVNDTVRATVGLLRTDEAVGKVVNVGNGKEITIRKLAERVKRLTESDSPIKMIPYEEVYGEGFEDMERRTPDISRVEALVGYQPQHDIDDILQDVIEDLRVRTGRPDSWKAGEVRTA